MTDQHQPKGNRSAEQQLCSALQGGGEGTFGQIATLVAPDDFTYEPYRSIARAQWACVAKGLPITLENVEQYLIFAGVYGTTVREIDLVRVDDGALSSVVARAADTALIIRGFAQTRHGHKLADTFGARLREATPDTITAILHDIAQEATAASSLSAVRKDYSYKGWKNRPVIIPTDDMQKPAPRTGLLWVDKLTKGLTPAKAHIIHGDPKAGKTTWLRNLLYGPLLGGVACSMFLLDGTEEEMWTMWTHMIAVDLMERAGKPKMANLHGKPIDQYDLDDQMRPVDQRTEDQQWAIGEAEVLMDGNRFIIYPAETEWMYLENLISMLHHDYIVNGMSLFSVDYLQAIVSRQKATGWYDAPFERACRELGQFMTTKRTTGFLLDQNKDESGMKKKERGPYSPNSKGGLAAWQLAHYWWTPRRNPTGDNPAEMQIGMQGRGADYQSILYPISAPSGRITAPTRVVKREGNVSSTAHEESLTA